MPELPEVETVRRGLSAAVAGDVVATVELRRADLRFPFPPGFARRLAGRRIERITRRAKYLLFHLDRDIVLIAHLGMSGSFRVEGEAGSAGLGTLYRGATKDRRHDHVVMHLTSGRRVIYNDPRRFGMMDLATAATLATSRHLATLGLEPLDPAFDAAALARVFAGRRTPLKSALLDQRLVAGIGNIYACEALWRARLSPDRPAATLLTPAGRVSARAV
ncbi:MAG: bifunctional DNA-formamidopyrimidine glycosylase/DNA-(apurinic or apyrimidinic site) lyase, partial [Alphaproteobacteria bacterium]